MATSRNFNYKYIIATYKRIFRSHLLPAIPSQHIKTCLPMLSLVSRHWCFWSYSELQKTFKSMYNAPLYIFMWEHSLRWTWHMSPRIFLPPVLPANIPPCRSTCPSPLTLITISTPLFQTIRGPYHLIPPCTLPHVISVSLDYRRTKFSYLRISKFLNIL